MSDHSRLERLLEFTVVGGMIGAACLYCIKVARPYEIFVKSGFLVRGSKGALGKKFGTWLFVLPRVQQFSRINMAVEKMTGDTSDVYTSEGHKVSLNWFGAASPCVHPEFLSIYVNRLNMGGDSVKDIVQQRVSSALRAMTARTALHDINVERNLFSREIEKELQETFRCQFGLDFSFSIEQVVSTVLDTNSQRMDATAKSGTRIEVSTAENSAEQRISEQHRLTVEVKAAQDKLEAEATANLNMRTAQLQADVGIQQALATAKVQQENARLAAEVERAKAIAQTEAKRAVDLAEANVQAEVLVRQAKANAEKIELEANAKLFSATQEARAIQLNGEAQAISISAQGKAQADVIKAQGLAQAEAAHRLVEAFGNPQLALGVKIMESGQLPAIAKAQSDILGKANVYFVGDGQKLVSTLGGMAPMLDMMKDFGYGLPSWLATNLSQSKIGGMTPEIERMALEINALKSKSEM